MMPRSAKKVLDIAKLRVKPMAQPDGMADDGSGKRWRRCNDSIRQLSLTR
jgi:hypothetical protein